MATQLEMSKSGISDEVRLVAENESIEAEELRRKVAIGEVVIPANKLHLESNLLATGIGRILRTKVNANIGTSSVTSSFEDEINKLEAALEAGTDTVMDLSTGGDLVKIREELLSRCPVSFGTVPIYETIVGRSVEDIDEQVILEVIEKQARQGVDFFTIHAGVLKEHLPLLEKRIGGIVSRGGALLSKWMLHHNRQNPLYDIFDDLCGIMREYDVCFSLGDGLRPGAIADASDSAQMAELRTLGELTERARENGCQVMVEGPGHIPFNEIQYNMEIEQEICKGAPFYVLGPIVTDISPGYDHITSAIGGTAAAYYGASFLCYVTPSEHLGLPGVQEVRAGVIAARIAAHSADIARELKGAGEQDRKVSKARANLDWRRHLASSIDPELAEAMHLETCKAMEKEGQVSADYCSMCGKQWCSVRINKEIRSLFGKEKAKKS